MSDVVILTDSPNLRKAVANKHIVKYPDKTDGKNSLDHFAVRMNAADAVYNGYFALKVLDQSEDDMKNSRLRVAVCNGWTWDEEKETSESSLAYVNGEMLWFASKIVTVDRVNKYIVLRYNYSEDTCAIMSTSALIYEPFALYDYVIGELVIRDDKTSEVIQRHKGDGANVSIVLDIKINTCLVGSLEDKTSEK